MMAGDVVSLVASMAQFAPFSTFLMFCSSRYVFDGSRDLFTYANTILCRLALG